VYSNAYSTLPSFTAMISKEQAGIQKNRYDAKQ